jgi:hypothetical protein
VTDELYHACDILSGNDVIVKLEQVDGKDRTLHHEYQIYTKLNGGPGIPRVHCFCTESGFDAMTIDRLGPSLEDLFIHCRFQFLVKTVLLLAGQLVSK